jgi:hypothetical protein
MRVSSILSPKSARRPGVDEYTRSRFGGRGEVVFGRVRQLAATVVLLLGSGAAAPHEIPGRADVELWAAERGGGVQVAARVPLGALQDLELPRAADGTFDPAEAGAALHDAATLWVTDFLAVRAGGERLPAPLVLGVQASLPSDRSFASFDGARRHFLDGALPAGTRLRPEQAHLDVFLEVSVPRELRGRALYLEPDLAHLGVRTVVDLRILTREGEVRTLVLDGSPGPVPLDPGVLWTSGTFLLSGVEHILGGLDHLLFLLCLVLPVLALRPLVVMVTAFTVGHTVTLVAATLGWAPRGEWFPALMETFIAASIVWLAIANLLRVLADRRAAAAVARWRPAFLFGLVHGFGFAFMLAERLHYSGDHLLLALATFNLGVEVGQVLFLLVAVPLLRLALDRVPARAAQGLLAALVLHTAWHWMLERGAVAAAYPLALPAADLVLLRGALQAALLTVVAFALYRLLGIVAARFLGPEEGDGATLR